MRLATIIAAAVLIGATTGTTRVDAEDATEHFSASYQACITYGETHGTTAVPVAECDARELRLQDGRLNASYKAAMARVSPGRRADLRTDERNWILARDQRCGARGEDDTRECVITETIKRELYLRRQR